MKVTLEMLVKEFLCPGCSAGGGDCPNCSSYKADELNGCMMWSPGTFMFGKGNIMLGFPIGFNKTGPVDKERCKLVCFHLNKMGFEYNIFNLPVWTMLHTVYLEGEEVTVRLVRRYMPRSNHGIVDIIYSENGTPPAPAFALDVTKAVKDMD